jgi:tripartite-type tricarboxylate transporter receptor subunit TctC
MRQALSTRRRFQHLLLALAGACAVPLAADAQNFPSKPVRLVVTYPPGGSSDLMARIMGQKLGEYWGQPVIIESKPGAAGSIGMEYTARQPADGYTFVVGNLGPVAVNPLITKVPYNMDKDFIPIALTATGPNILVVPMTSPYKNLAELLAAARANPGSLNFGTSGPGSMAHLGGEMIIRQANVKLVGVPYKGGGQAVNDLLAGHLNMMVADALPVSQFIKTNRLRPLAVTSAKRLRMFPDVPTFAEAGLNGLVADNWWGAFLPAGTPKAIVDNYHAALVKIMAEPDLKEKFAALGVEAQASTQDEFKAFLKEEISKYTKLVAENGIKGE